MSVPVVDFSACSLTRADVDGADMRSVSRELRAAFTQVGLVFLQNTGISQEEVNKALDAAMRFFQQEDEVKGAFRRGSFPRSPNHGWVCVGSERLNPGRPADLKEAFNMSSLHPDIPRFTGLVTITSSVNWLMRHQPVEAQVTELRSDVLTTAKWPSGSLSDFRDTQTSLFLRCKELGLRVLTAMAVSLDLDPELFLSAHRLVGTEQNGTTLRSLFYPPVKREQVKEGQLRCGEHSDYGSITLLFQSSEGLQVRSLSGDYIDVPVVPGAILVNIADLMQRWTSDRFVSVLHRVLLPPAGDPCTRQSMAFFLHPDDDAEIRCCDGSDQYPPVSSGEYLWQRLRASN